MENKINIAELLRDCPKGMELDCTIWDREAKVFFKRVLNDDFAYPIEVTVKYNNTEDSKSFTKYGAFNDLSYCKCVIFPKGKNTWEGFVPPCKFKDGDILTTITGSIFIYKKIDVYNYCGIYASLDIRNGFLPTYCSYLEDCCRFATEEEKQKLFDAIKDNGYRWNAETKTLEELVEPKFKLGDRVKSIYNNYQYDIKKITNTHYTLVGVEDKFKYTEPIIKDKNWELVPNKFDIATLKPFDKVLVRDGNKDKWNIDFFGYYRDDGTYQCMTFTKNQCIPYEVNQHLLGTTNDCDDFYKTWEK